MAKPENLNATVEQAGGLAVLKGKVALVTGGESGIGQASCVAMARAGATVISAGRSEVGGSISAKGAGLLKGRAAQSGSETVRMIEDIGGKASYVKIDVTVEDDWKRAVEVVGKQYGKLDILVNNAGNVGGDALSTTDMKTVMYVYTLNVEGAFLGMTHFWPMLKKSRGVVFNMNSTAGITGSAGGFAYPASKGGMFGLSKGAARDGRADGIRVISIHPGSTWTPGMQRARAVDEEEFLKRSVGIPLKRPAYPADVAASIVYFSSDAAKHFSGLQFNIDGGTIAR